MTQKATFYHAMVIWWHSSSLVNAGFTHSRSHCSLIFTVSTPQEG